VRFNNRFLALNETGAVSVRDRRLRDAVFEQGPDLQRHARLRTRLRKGYREHAVPLCRGSACDGRGTLVEFSSPDSIADAVIRLLDNKEERESLENAAYVYSRRAAWFNVAIDYLDLFHRLITRDRLAKQTALAASDSKQ